MKFLLNERAIVHGKYLIVADLHLGLEHELWRKGIRVPFLSEKIKRRLLDIVERTKARVLIINGDFKHDYLGFTEKSKEKLKEFVKELREYIDVLFIKGNHDSKIEEIAEHVEKKIEIGRYLITHGHMNIDENEAKKHIVIGHEHASVEINTLKIPCWLVLEGKITVMPAFNEFSSGDGFKKVLSPILKKIDISDADLYTLDARYLGKLREILGESDEGGHRMLTLHGQAGYEHC